MIQVTLPYEVESGTLSTMVLNWPERCACCMNEEAPSRYTLEHRAELKTVDSDFVSYYPLSWAVPYCPTCLIHVRRPSSLAVGISLAGFGLWVAIGYGLFLLGLGDGAIGMALFLLSLLVIGFVGYRLHKLLVARYAPTHPSCSRRDVAIVVSSSADEQEVVFTFYNDNYASAFAASNGGPPAV